MPYMRFTLKCLGYVYRRRTGLIKTRDLYILGIRPFVGVQLRLEEQRLHCGRSCEKYRGGGKG